MEKQQPAKASLQFHCGESKKKKKKDTVGVEKLRRVWDGCCICGRGKTKKKKKQKRDEDVNRERSPPVSWFAHSSNFKVMFHLVSSLVGPGRRSSALTQHLSTRLSFCL